MSLSRYTSIALATLFIICACEKIEPENEENGKNNGKNDSEIPGDPTPTILDDTVTVSKDSEFPEPWTLWNGHVVILVNIFQEYPDSADILLLAKEESSNVYSYYHETRSNDAWIYTNSYSEGGITGWQIPDELVAEHLRDSCNDQTNLSIVNKLLKDAITIVPYKNYGKSYERYLCRPSKVSYKEVSPEATLTFAFVAGSSITKAGAKTSYRLRPVKWITLAKEKK